MARQIIIFFCPLLKTFAHNWSNVSVVFLWFLLLGALAKLRKATISLVMSLCQSDLPRVTTLFPTGEFS